MKMTETATATKKHVASVANQLDSVEAHFGKTIEWKLALGQEWQDNHLTAGAQVFWSPIFDLAGVRGLQVEAKLTPGTTWDAPCRVVCKLWAGGDVCLNWRLSVGGKPSAPFRHVFRKHAPVGSSWQFDKTEVKSHMNLGLEIAEAMIPQYNPKSFVSDMMPGSSTMVPQIVKIKKNVMHQTHELVQASVAKLGSKMVKKIEWTIDDVRSKAMNYDRGEPLRSPLFAACGVDNLQFWFYPAGYTTSSEGFFGLFLAAPVGTEVRCTITAGQSRMLHHRFEGEQAEPFGRANFSKLTNV